MEAAGIEPASRDTSAEVSTCVVCWFNLGLPAPSDRLRTAQRRDDLTRVSRRLPSRACLLSSPRQIAGVSDGTGHRFRQPLLMCYHWQLKLCQVFYQASWQPGHAAATSTCPGEPNSPPRRTPY